MSETALQTNDRVTAIVTSIIAVMAAIGTLLAQHQSIAALAAKTHAIILQSRASDRINVGETKSVRYDLITTLDASGLITSKARKGILELAERERKASQIAIADSQALELQAKTVEERADQMLVAYQTFEIGATMLEVAVVLVSLSALAGRRLLFTIGCSVALGGVGCLIFGFFQAHP
jgi:hypothetical protein